MVQYLPRKLSFFGGDERGVCRLGQQATDVVERTIWDVARQPAVRRGGDPRAPHLVERVG
jgi:hypothetical protein